MLQYPDKSLVITIHTFPKYISAYQNARFSSKKKKKKKKKKLKRQIS